MQPTGLGDRPPVLDGPARATGAPAQGWAHLVVVPLPYFPVPSRPPAPFTVKPLPLAADKPASSTSGPWCGQRAYFHTSLPSLHSALSLLQE